MHATELPEIIKILQNDHEKKVRSYPRSLLTTIQVRAQALWFASFTKRFVKGIVITLFVNSGLQNLQLYAFTNRLQPFLIPTVTGVDLDHYLSLVIVVVGSYY